MSDIHVVFADNHPLTLSGLRSAVAGHSDIHILAECVDREHAIEAVRGQSPDVLLLSAELMQEEFEILRRLGTEHQETRVILLTSRRDPEFLEEALRCGIKGVFEREQPTRYIPKAIRKVTQGGLWFDQAVAEHMLGEFMRKQNKVQDSDEHRIASITEREQEVIELTCRGLRNKQVSDRLHISEVTVSHHLTSIFRKLEVADRISLLIYAVKKRLVVL